MATIPPGATNHVEVIGGPGYCKFTGFFNKSLVRAALHTYDTLTSGSIVVLPAH